MDSNENEICQYLKSYPTQFVSRKEICRRAGGRWRYRENENWAVPILQRMIEINLVETDGEGRFRLAEQEPNKKEKRKKLWISPTIKAILRQSGRDFAVIDLDTEVDPADWAVNSGQSVGSLLEDQSGTQWQHR